MFPAKPRIDSEKVGELMKLFPGGYYEPSPSHGLDTYLEAIDSFNESSGDDAGDWRAEVDKKFGRVTVAGPIATASLPKAPSKTETENLLLAVLPWSTLT